MSKKIVSERKKWKLEGEESEEWPPRMNYPWSKLQLNEANKDNNGGHNNCNDDNSYNVSNSSNVRTLATAATSVTVRCAFDTKETRLVFIFLVASCSKDFLVAKDKQPVEKFKRKWKFFFSFGRHRSVSINEKKKFGARKFCIVRASASVDRHGLDSKGAIFASKRNPVGSMKT